MSEHRNFSACCRLCLCDSGVESLRSIFDDGPDERSLQQRILASLGVEITMEDKVSTLICAPCTQRITSWQTYRSLCLENQSKLDQWLHLSELQIHIKEEPLDEVVAPEIPHNGEIRIKSESIELIEEEYNDLPPQLSPQATDPEVSRISNPKRCTVCNKLLSSVGNRKKHERYMHGLLRPSSATESDIGSFSQDDRSQSSIGSHEVVATPKASTGDEQKILFAAGLKLLQRNSTPPIAFENLSKIENSYIAKCKAMVQMHATLTCACHNVVHPNLKGLLSHLRALRIWFPVFTCYHCMITFTERSSSTRHYMKCPKSNLETLVKLSNLKKRSEVKTRLYQNYKCKQCRFMFTFHEDYCIHVDEDHTDIDFPYTCECGRIFATLEDYKDHAYVSCLVEYYCDICFVTVKTLDEFQKHASETHDHSEGFILLQDDNYRRRKASPTAPTRVSAKREHADVSNILSGKRKISLKAPMIEPEDGSNEEKVLNPANVQLPGTICPICNREYSSNNNMWRHYKTHAQGTDDPGDDDSLYCCPDCGGMFSSSEWEEHKGQHEQKTCKECGKVFQFQSELDQHRSVHLNIKVYRDSKTHAYKSTMVNSNNEPSVVVLCEICNRMFTTKEQLNEHKLTHEKMPVLESAVDPQPPHPKKRYSCIPCNKHYFGHGGLWYHNRKKHPEDYPPQGEFPKQCKYCDRVLNTASSFFMHKQMHERKQSTPKLTPEVEVAETKDDDGGESYHTCKRCFKVFSNRYTLKQHMKCHGINLSPTSKSPKKAGKKVWCDVCHCPFDNAALLQKHKAAGHAENEEMPNLDEEMEMKAPFVFTCDVCVATFTTKAGLKKHKLKHVRETKLKTCLVYCKYCRISFENAILLGNHMKEEHMEGDVLHAKAKAKQQFACKVCKKIFNSQAAVLTHQAWHRRARTNPVKDPPLLTIVKEEPVQPEFMCRTCKAVLPNDTALQIHILEKHRNVNATVLPGRCHTCNMDFASQEDYDNHKKYHAMLDKTPKKYPCLHCTATFTRADNLRTHVKNLHKDVKLVNEFRCHQCDRVFDKSNSLSIHLKVHEKQRISAGAVVTPIVAEKPTFMCSICNKSFGVPKDLRAHTIQAHPF